MVLVVRRTYDVAVQVAAKVDPQKVLQVEVREPPPTPAAKNGRSVTAARLRLALLADDG
jgi:hypothetical protein